MAIQSKGVLGYLDTVRPQPTFRQLVWLALPVIASSFMSMAYNFINLIFVGTLGSNAVAAVGSAGFYMNLSWAISSLITVGAGIKVSHSVGEGNLLLAKSYVRSGILAVAIVSLGYCLLMALSREYLIGLIHLQNVEIERVAAHYLLLIGISIPFSFQNLFFTSVFIGYGDSRTPFRINASALAINIVLDAVLIFGAGLGVNGAAIATILSQATATILFYRKLRHTRELRPHGVTYRRVLLKRMVSMGVSPTIQRVSFTIVAIMMARVISNWGPAAIAVQKVGVQVEAISYMTIGGFMSALATLSGKAYGAKDYHKQWEVFTSGMVLAVLVGVLTTTILVLFPVPLFSIFLSDATSVALGRDYLVILGFSQLFICLELMATGAFFGWGRTTIPAMVGITFTALRIPMAYALIHFWRYDLTSVWWSISISSMAKGVVLVALYVTLFKLFVRNSIAR